MATVSVVFRTCGIIIVFISLCLQLTAAKITPPVISSFTVTNENYLQTQNNGELYKKCTVQFEGIGFFGNIHWKLTSKSDEYGSQCDDFLSNSDVYEIFSSKDKYVADIVFPVTDTNVFLCLLFDEKWIHQGKSVYISPFLTEEDSEFKQRNVAHDIHYTDAGQLPLPAASRDESLLSQAQPEDRDRQQQQQRDTNNKYVAKPNDMLPTTEDKSVKPDRDLEKGLEAFSNGVTDKVLKGLENEDKPQVLLSDKEESSSSYYKPSKDSLDGSEQIVVDVLRNSDNVPGDIEETSYDTNVEQLNVLKAEAENLRREPVIVEVSNELNNKVLNSNNNEKDREYLSKATDYNGNLDELVTNVETFTPGKNWIDLSHDIDVNYDENGMFIQQTEESNSVPDDRYKYLIDETGNGEPKNEIDVNFVSINDKKSEKVLKEKMEEANTWKYFKESADKIPSHWIDLSHDIDVNYPSENSGIVLDVEGVDVEKNIFDKGSQDFEDIEVEEPLRSGGGEFDEYAVESFGPNGQQSKETNTESVDTPRSVGIETFDKRNKIVKEPHGKVNEKVASTLDKRKELENREEVMNKDGEEYSQEIHSESSRINDINEEEKGKHHSMETQSMIVENTDDNNSEGNETTQVSEDGETFDEMDFQSKVVEVNHKSEENKEYDNVLKRRKREITALPDDLKPPKDTDFKSSTNYAEKSTTIASPNVLFRPRASDSFKVESLRVEESDRDLFTEVDGIPELLSDTESVIRIFGTGITQDLVITFTHQANPHGGPCQFPVTGTYQMIEGSATGRTAKVKVVLPVAQDGHGFFVCAKKPSDPSDMRADTSPFIHQGYDTWLQLRTYSKLLPIWASFMIICVCLMFSALFSGLNLGLMSLDRTELKILCNTGTEKEKEYARIIQPVRDHGNYLLCSILLGNVAVNSTFTILLDDLTSGLVAVICSTITIVLLGEITPQAICSRYGLAVGAKTIHVTKAVMVVTFPLSYPVSKLLDFLLGEEIGNVYNRERLKELVRVTNDINDLDKDEVNIISGALELRKKTVLEIMTKIEDVFMLDYEAVLDFETVSEIMKSGFSRIPVFEGKRGTIVAMLYVKDLAFVDPDDNTPLKTLCQFYQNPCNFVFEDVTLDVIFKQFKEGHKGHLAFVQRVNSEGEGDPFYETIGLVTLEDVIEELIQAEIMDETDVFTDNKSKRRRNRPLNKLQDFGVFAERRENQRIRISPQLTLATFQYLSTSVEAFKPDQVSETILRRMLKQDIIHHIKFRNKERQKMDPSTLIYEQGKAVDYFVLILEGRVEVTVGKEKLVFESGPFTYFGSQALMQNIGIAESPVIPPSALGSLQSINMDSMLRYTFVPDYSVRAVTEVFYVNIKRSLYLAAKRATLMEKCSGNRQKGSDDAGEQFDDEVEKLLHSLEEEGSPVTTVRSPSHHLNSRHASPMGPNGSIKASRQSSPAKHAPVAQQEPEFIDVTPVAPQETSTLLPQS